MRILIVKTSSLGDLFHALPTVHLLKQSFDADIDWVVNSEYTGLTECFSDVQNVIAFPRKELLSNLGTFRAALRKETYDLIVDLQGLMKSALICRMAKRSSGAKILGPSFQREGARLLYSAVVGKKNKKRHAVDENLDVLRWLKNPQFFRLALAFAFVEFGHEGYFAEHGASFKLSFPKSDLLPAILMMGAGLNAFNILFLEPLITKCGVTTPTKAIMATVSMTLCYGLWSFGNLPLTFIGELVGLMALMFKPSVTFMLTAR